MVFMAAVLPVVALGFAAFTFDFGMITLTKGQWEADASLAADFRQHPTDGQTHRGKETES